MHKSYQIRNTKTNNFIGNGLTSVVSFPSKESAILFLETNYEYGINYEIVEVYYSFKTL